MWDSLYICTEPLLNRWPFNKLVREKALQVTMKHIHYEDENSRYITIGCVVTVMCIRILIYLVGLWRKFLSFQILIMLFALLEQVLCMLACWVEDPNGDYFKKHLVGLTIHLVTSKACTTTFLKDHGLSQIKTMDGKFLIAPQRV